MNEAIKVLYVEDNPADIRLVREMLSESPGEFDLEAVGRLSEGVERLSTNEYDIVLIDLGLPDSNGLETFNTLFSPERKIPAIILSGLDDEELAIQAVKDGAQSYLLKDKINTFSLSEAIRYSMERCRLLVELRQNANELRKRVKELNCLHEISKIVENDNADVGEILQNIVNTIPPAFLYPENTVARITIGDTEFISPNFMVTKTILSEPILVSGERLGRIDVYLLDDGTRRGAQNFLDEERDLVRTISERLGRIIDRVQSEERLKINEEKYHDLYENAPDMFCSVDAKTRKIIQCNQTSAKLLGYTKEEIIGRSIFDMYHPDCLKKVKEEVLPEFMKTGEIHDAELILQRKDGSKLDVSLNVSAVRDENDKIIYSRSIWHDITERKRAEKERINREKYLDSIIDQSPFATWISDAEGTLQRANPALKRLLNLTDEQLVGKYNVLKDQIVERAGLLPLIRTVFNEGKTVNFTLEWDGNDIPSMDLQGSKSIICEGTMFPIQNSNGDLTNVVLNWIDITDRKRAQDNIKHLNRLLNSVRNINQLIVKEKDREVLLQRVCEILVEISGYFFVWIGVVSEEHKKVLPVARWGIEDGYLDAITITYDDDNTAKGPSGKAIKAKKPRVCNDLMNDPHYAPWREEARKRGYRSSIAVPIIHQDTMYGLLNVYSDCIDHFSTDEIELLEEASRDIGYALFVIDIEEKQKEIYEQLEKSEERYRTTLDSMLEGCQIIDHEWRYVYVNENAARHGLRKREELLGKTIMEMYPGITDTNIFHTMSECMKTRSPRQLENEFVYPDGSSRWFELSIQPVPNGLFVLSIDISDRKQAENDLKESQKRLVEAQRIARMGDFTWDVDTGEATWSDAMYELLGYDKNEKIDYDIVARNIHHPDDLQKISRWLMDCVSSGRDDLTPMEYRILKKDGSVLYVRTMGVIERGEGGAAKVFATLQDITERKRAEHALIESEEFLRTIITCSPVALYSIDLEGNVSSWNSSAERIFGWTESEVIGKPLPIVPEGQEDEFVFLNKMLGERGYFFGLEIVRKRKDGSDIDLSLSSAQIRDAQGAVIGIVGAAEDITEKRKVEKALRESEEKYRNLFETSRDVIYRSSIDGELLDINKMGETITGYTRDELIGMNVVYAFNGNPEKRVEFQKEIEKKGYIDDFEGVYRVKDGTVKYGLETAVVMNDNEGNVVGYQGIIRDITERKIAAEKLRESEEKWRNLFESSMDVVYLTSIEGKIIDMNEAGERLFGYTREELPSINAVDLYYDPNDRKKYKDIMKSQGYVKDYEITFKRKDGSPIECVVTASIRKDASGNILGYQGAIRDITDMKKMQQKLIQTEKLSSLGGILSGVAHELNNPLTAIIGFSELLTREDLPEDTIEKLNLIVDQSKRSAKIVKSLLTFAREHKPERKMTDVNTIIQDSFNLREYELRTNNITVRLDLQKDIPKTLADPYQLEQVFVNMINNAYQAMKEQGGGSLIIRSLQKNKKIVINFIDDGPGIPKEYITKIFDPFFTTKEVGEGTGLGLSIVYGIVEEHGGDVYVDSMSGRGATFTIELPIVERKETLIKDTIKKPTKPDKQYSILVVEDEDSLRKFISDALLHEGYDTKTSRNGEEAIDMLEENEFDAVITDIKMPGLSGQNLYTYIQKYHEGIENKVLFITGDVLGADTRYFFQITGCKYLSKPFDLDDLFVMLNDLLLK